MCFADGGATAEGEVQVSRCVGLVSNEDVLEGATAFTNNRRDYQRTLHAGARGQNAPLT